MNRGGKGTFSSRGRLTPMATSSMDAGNCQGLTLNTVRRVAIIDN
jgi:hypothetical protein